MKHAEQRAATLIEALPYLQRLSDQTVVIKYGGSAMVEERLKASFAMDVVLLKQVGINPVVVHGGGPQIGSLLKKIGKDSKFVHGIRVTDSETMDVVEMVLAGLVNKEIVANINQAGGRAVGLSGKDGGLICARKITAESDAPELNVPEIINLGHVGAVKKINPQILHVLEQDRFIPVIAPVGYNKQEGLSYNINADLVASAVARELGAAKLILLTDVPGVLNGQGELCPELDIQKSETMVRDGVIAGGMIPKVRCCTSAVSHGVQRSHIIDGRIPHALVLEIFTDQGIGTVFSGESTPQS